MKSFEQVARAMYLAFVKEAARATQCDAGSAIAWEDQAPETRACWIAAARQAAAELALVH